MSTNASCFGQEKLIKYKKERKEYKICVANWIRKLLRILPPITDGNRIFPKKGKRQWIWYRFIGRSGNRSMRIKLNRSFRKWRLCLPCLLNTEGCIVWKIININSLNYWTNSRSTKLSTFIILPANYSAKLRIKSRTIFCLSAVRV